MTEKSPPPAPAAPEAEPYDNGFRFTLPINEDRAATKARLFEYHKAAHSLDLYYSLIPRGCAGA